ncbi:MAG: proprotein convertase P-domain-containing protein [Bradymonadales bacterium]|nr:proprotein convertase P-domain-containing protein [Bradymonadales bacterium]
MDSGFFWLKGRASAVWGVLFVLALWGIGCAAVELGGDLPTGDPYATEASLSSLDALLEGAPDPNSLPEDGKYDAVYPAQFDLVRFQSPVRNQASRGVCSIFSTVALMEHLYVREGSIASPDFSEQFLQWSVKVESRRFTTTEGSNANYNLEAINRHGIVLESAWPYQTSRWNSSHDAACTGEDDQPIRCYTNGDPPESALAARRWHLPRGRWLNTAERSIKGYMVDNQLGVVVGLEFFYQSWNHRRSTLPINRENWSEGYVLYPNQRDIEVSRESPAGHSILLVGWDDDLTVPIVDENGDPVLDDEGNPQVERGFFIFKNSWGTGSFGVRNPHGDGYGYISMRYVQQFGNAYSSTVPVVQLDREICDDGIDNSLDGRTDCDDPACADDPACRPSDLRFQNDQVQDIPDNSPAGVSSVIPVPVEGTISSVRAEVALTHTYRGDLRVTLRSPRGTEAVLHNRTGGSEDNLALSLVLDDFSGELSQGDWTLTVADLAAHDTGQIERWSLELVLSGEIGPEDCDDEADNNGDGLVDCEDPLCFDDEACGQPETLTFTNDEAQPIPDNNPNGIISGITIDRDGVLASLNVDVNITHTFRGDLVVKLHHPDGDEVTLTSREGGNLSNLVRRFTVDQFNGLNIRGDWILEVSDNAQIDTGTLNSWGLEMVVR